MHRNLHPNALESSHIIRELAGFLKMQERMEFILLIVGRESWLEDKRLPGMFPDPEDNIT